MQLQCLHAVFGATKLQPRNVSPKPRNLNPELRPEADWFLLRNGFLGLL